MTRRYSSLTQVVAAFTSFAEFQKWKSNTIKYLKERNCILVNDATGGFCMSVCGSRYIWTITRLQKVANEAYLSEKLGQPSQEAADQMDTGG